MARCIAVALLSVIAACGTAAKVADLVVEGPEKELREREDEAPKTSRSAGEPLLVLLFDGVDRTTLYELLRDKQMPALDALLGRDEAGSYPHAVLDERLLSTLPSSTFAAWTTAITGEPPAVHGVTGNEFFMRETMTLGAPAPVSFEDAEPSVAVYSDNYLDSLRRSPSVYERMRERDPSIQTWVVMHGLHSGADKLLLTKRTILANAFSHTVEKLFSDPKEGSNNVRGAYAMLDEQAIEVTIEALEDGPVPDVLTIYLPGTDLYAHVAEEGCDEARRTYLTEVVDPALAKLTEKLRALKALDDRYVVITADHGHTPIVKDEIHALSTDRENGPVGVLTKKGFKVRPFKLDVDKDEPYDTVFVAGGAMAYIYAADRSQCSDKGVCDWNKAPRYKEDVLAIADAYWRASAKGDGEPSMKGTLDFVLTRKPKPAAEIDEPFEVYVGKGRTVPLAKYLAEHPHPTYVDMVERLRDLAVGPHGDHAGDVVLLAHNGDRDKREERYYFASPYHSWHGSPSRRDSEIPLIVAHQRKTSLAIRERLDRQLEKAPYQQKVASLLVDLRYGTTLETAKMEEGPQTRTPATPPSSNADP